MGQVRRRSLTLVALGGFLAVGSAHAQGGGQQQNPQAALALFALLPVLATVFQLLLAAVWPQAVHRLSQAAQSRREATVGWGVLGTVLLVLVLGTLAVVGQQVGQVLAVLVLLPVTVVIYACMSGVSNLVGAWCLRRDGKEDQPTFLSVLIGSLVITLISWVPVFGVLLWIALSVYAIGCFARSTIGAPPVDSSPYQPEGEPPQ